MKLAWGILIIGIVISVVSIGGILWCYLYKGTVNKSPNIKNKKVSVNDKKTTNKDVKPEKDNADEGTELLEEEEGTALLEDSDGTQLLH